ncbi:Ank2 [Symbiodinium necroappetens]|uniref:Ank2 protein n=1 Tax=Symbiodinium necroappetens TaxID=1628268 RepID=A0A812KNM2_9DINO|nr:Ank2 [Symbiodinium necroappetens]
MAQSHLCQCEAMAQANIMDALPTESTAEETEYWYPPGLTGLHVSVIHDAAREFGLECQCTVSRPEESQVLLRKGALVNPSETPVVHAGIVCDGCNCVPQGIRYHCRDCDDFDFCEACHSKWQRGDLCHAQEHRFDAMSFVVQPRKLILASVMNAFQLAAGLGLTKMVELMFQHSDANRLLQSETNQGHSALHLACQRRRLPMLEVLLEARADCNVKNGKERSVLDCATRLPSYMKDDKEELTDLVRTLLKARADPTVVAENGDCPLHQAVGHNNWSMAQALLEARADPNAHGLGGRTALHMAAHTGRDIIARRLLEARADPTIRSAESGMTAEEEALRKEKHAVAREIRNFDSRSAFSAGPPLPIQRKQSSGSSASTAATEGYLPAEIRPQSMEQLGTGAARVLPEVDEAEGGGGGGSGAPGPPRPALHCEGIFALRHALLVCNSYKQDEAQGDLSNAVPTGRKLQHALLRAGFKVRLSEDADGTVFEEQVSTLVCELQSQPEQEHLVVFYFAGHGAEVAGDLMMRMPNDASGGFPLRAVLERILTSVPKVGVVALPDCCRENSEDKTFRASPAEAHMAQAPKAKVTSGSSVDMAGNFYVVWAGDRGTCIEDRCEDNLGFQLASVLKESRGAMLDEILQLACDQVRRRTGNAAKGVVSQLQRPWIQRGDGQNLARHVLRPILCHRCQDFRRGKDLPQDMHQASRILTAEGFAKILESRSPCASGASKELCALAALNGLEARQLEDPHPEALSAFFCAAARANAVPVLRFMLHLHPELIGHLGYDAFDYASHYLGGRPTVSAARRTPVLAVAASAGCSREALEFLLVARADVTARDCEEWTAHHHASFEGACSSLATLLKSSGSAQSAEAWALTPLHLAASAGHADCVRLLLLNGTSPDEATPEGWRPSELEKVIHADPKAVQHQHVILRQLGQSQMGKPLGRLRPLHLAAAAGHLDCVEALLQARADANVLTEGDLTALLLCLKKWHLQLDKPKKLDGKRLRNEHKDHAGIFDALLAAGARDIFQDGCETGLHAVAFHWGSVDPPVAIEVASRLIDEAQSSIHARARAGGTPLHWAVNGRNWALCSLLLERRADPSIRNDMERAVWDLPILEESGQWRNADGELCRKKLKELRGIHTASATSAAQTSRRGHGWRQSSHALSFSFVDDQAEEKEPEEEKEQPKAVPLGTQLWLKAPRQQEKGNGGRVSAVSQLAQPSALGWPNLAGQQTDSDLFACHNAISTTGSVTTCSMQRNT